GEHALNSRLVPYRQDTATVSHRRRRSDLAVPEPIKQAHPRDANSLGYLGASVISAVHRHSFADLSWITRPVNPRSSRRNFLAGEGIAFDHGRFVIAHDHRLEENRAHLSIPRLTLCNPRLKLLKRLTSSTFVNFPLAGHPHGNDCALTVAFDSRSSDLTSVRLHKYNANWRHRRPSCKFCTRHRSFLKIGRRGCPRKCDPLLHLLLG